MRALAGIVVLLLGGCAASPPSPAPAQTAPPAGVLLTIQARGGLCANGPCDTTVFVERDGSVHQAGSPPNEIGVVDPAALATLEDAIQRTDFDVVRSRPFTDTCPIAYDGQEFVFEFSTPDGIERIASCEVDVDYRSPLFVAVAFAVQPFVALPQR